MFNETNAINEYLNGNVELEEMDYADINLAELHNAEKVNAASKRKTTIKARKHKENIPVSNADAQFRAKTAKEKKAYKKASHKANRRASEMVNSSRGLSRKVYSDLDDKIKNYI